MEKGLEKKKSETQNERQGMKNGSKSHKQQKRGAQSSLLLELKELKELCFPAGERR